MFAYVMKPHPLLRPFGPLKTYSSKISPTGEKTAHRSASVACTCTATLCYAVLTADCKACGEHKCECLNTDASTTSDKLDSNQRIMYRDKSTGGPMYKMGSVHRPGNPSLQHLKTTQTDDHACCCAKRPNTTKQDHF